MKFPKELKYTEDHEWVRLEKGNVAVVGITDYAQSELGDLVYVEVDTIGDAVAISEIFGTVEAVKTTSDLMMPVSGKIIEFNKELDENDGDNPTLINTHPYTEGWIIKVEMSNTDELEGLMDAETYENSIK